jgi:alpha-1,2-mannosyltransferase
VSGDLADLTRGDALALRASARVPWGRLRAYWLTSAGVAMGIATLFALGIRLYTLTRPGYLAGVTEYDDGVYLGSTTRLIEGALPYRDFAFIQPPGILLLMAPVALVAKVTTTTFAMAVARVLTALASTACVPLVGGLVRHRGALVTLVTCGVLAVYPDDVTTAHTLILEPWMNLCLLIGACFAFRDGQLARPGRLLWAGIAIGFAGAVKYWAALPAAVLLAAPLIGAHPDRVRRVLRYLSGVTIGFLAPVLPFALSAPATFVRSTLTDQATRQGSYVPLSMRLAHVTGLIDILNGQGRLSLDAGTHSLFASGGAAATSATSAGWLPFGVTIAAIGMLFSCYGLRPGGLSAVERFALLTAVASIIAIMAYSAFFYHYPDFAAPWLALSVGGAAGVLSWVGAPAVRGILVGIIGFIVIVAGVFQAHELSGLRAPSVSPDQAVIPSGSCVLTDEISMVVAANRFTAARPGCPDILDSLAQTLVLSRGVSVQGGAASLPNVVAAWRSLLGEASYVWLSSTNTRRIPWTPELSSWFSAHFVQLSTPGHGVGMIYKRA